MQLQSTQNLTPLGNFYVIVNLNYMRLSFHYIDPNQIISSALKYFEYLHSFDSIFFGGYP